MSSISSPGDDARGDLIRMHKKCQVPTTDGLVPGIVVA